jgi:hypothetical protein
MWIALSSNRSHRSEEQINDSGNVSESWRNAQSDPVDHLPGVIFPKAGLPELP